MSGLSKARFFADVGWMGAALLVPVVILVIVPEPTKLQMMILRLVSAIAVSSLAAHAVQQFFASSLTQNLQLLTRVLFLAVGFFSLDLWVIPALQWTARGSERPQVTYDEVAAQGVEKMRTGDFAGAYEFFTNQCPLFAEAGDNHAYTQCSLQLAEAALRSLQLDSARKAIAGALKRLPDDPALVGNVQEMRARIELNAARAAEHGDPQARDAAAQALDQAYTAYGKAEDPVGQANIWLRRADLQLLAGNIEEGEKALLQAAEVYRTHGQKAGLASTELLQGDVATKQDQFDVAEGHYQKALELYRELGDRDGVAGVTAAMGKLQLARGEHKAAGESLEKAGKMFAQSGNTALEKKVQVQQKTIPSTPVPKPPPTASELFAQAREAVRLKQDGRAEKLLREVTDAQPDNVEALSLLGRVLMQENKWAEAEAVLVRVLVLEPDLPAANNNLGLCELQQGDYKAAKARFEKVLKQEPDFAPAIYNLAVANKRLGKKRSARQQAKRFDAIRPKSKKSTALTKAVR